VPAECAGHVAWGQSFPFSVADGLARSNEERYEIGLIRAAVHTDVVIGGDGMTVTGRESRRRARRHPRGFSPISSARDRNNVSRSDPGRLMSVTRTGSRATHDEVERIVPLDRIVREFDLAAHVARRNGERREGDAARSVRCDVGRERLDRLAVHDERQLTFDAGVALWLTTPAVTATRS
jgi:hypothetical protein